MERGIATENEAKEVIPATREELESSSLAEDGDAQLADEILSFSTLLLENCGNRSLYASSERLGELLNTTSLPLLANVLSLLVRLAQRFHASRQRSSNASQSFNNALLASHYNIDLDKVQKLAEPFNSQASTASSAPLSATKKGKERPSSSRRGSAQPNVNDLLELLETTTINANGPAKQHSKSKSEKDDHKWDDLGNVSVKYFRGDVKDEDKTSTPGPRRASTFPKPSRLSSVDGTPNGDASEPTPLSSGTAHIDITAEQIRQQPMEALVADSTHGLPKDVRFDVLCQTRIAHAIVQSPDTRAQVLGIRLLALTNLAYIYSEDTFKHKILQRDSDEPRPLQIVQQLCDLLSPPSNKPVIVPIDLQTIVLGTLEAFAKHKSRASDVCTALGINVNHGVLFQLLRSAVAEMKNEAPDELDIRRENWREAGFALLETLPQCTPRAGESLISAGLLGVLVEVLNLRTPQAERSFPKTLTFLNNLVGPVRDAFETLAGANGLEAISSLLQHEVHLALEQAKNGKGLSEEYRNRLTDYQIPFYSQQTLRMIFKITREMMTNNSGNFSRLLRNFIESRELLGGLQTVIVNPKAFGSSVWSGAVNIMSSFIHSEPTSYTVVSEAGLSKGFLDTISTEIPSAASRKASKASKGSEGASSAEGAERAEQNDVQTDSNTEPPPPDPADHSTTALMNFVATKLQDRKALEENIGILPKGILPAGDAIISIPHAIGALCLNHAGMAALKKTNALENFFRIFESPSHVKTMSIEQELAQVLGSSFDELVRHHPALRIPVLKSLLTMVLRMKSVCSTTGKHLDSGAKLWLQHSARSRRTSAARDNTAITQDVTMTDASSEIEQLGRTISVDEPLSPYADGSAASADVTVLDYFNALVNFLTGVLENHHMVDYIGKSGIVDQLLELATLPVMRYDCNNHSAFIAFRKVLRTLADKNPSVVLPAIVQRMQTVLTELRPLMDHSGETSFFAKSTAPSDEQVPSSSISPSGTQVVQSLVRAQTLCKILSEIMEPPATYSRSQPMPFNQVNLTDIYVQIVKDLSSLHRICVWEDIQVMQHLPNNLIKNTTIKGLSLGSSQADEALGVTSAEDDLPGHESAPASADNSPTRNPRVADRPSTTRKQSTKVEKKTALFRNTRTLRFLLTQVPASIISMTQNLGKAVSGKRRSHPPDPLYHRQSAILISEAIASAHVALLAFEPARQSKEKDAQLYYITMLSSLSALMVDGKCLLKTL